jgi:hypothetical protein
MQTFLPYSDFRKCARVLDNKRLGKQRVEAYQILRILLGISTGKGWRNHPAVLMWRDHVDALMMYHNACIAEWVARGFRNEMKLYDHAAEPVMPPWIGNELLHRSHQSNLLRKDVRYYRPHFKGVRKDVPYWWPTLNEGKGGYQPKPKPKAASRARAAARTGRSLQTQ